MEVNEIIKYIDQNLARDLSLDDISKELGYSKYYVSRSFNIATNMSIPDYYMRRRLSEAVLSIADESASVTEIALMFGFNSSAYFTKKFKEYFMMTPSKYKNGSHYVYLQNILEIGEKKMHNTIEQQISYILDNVGSNTDIHTLLRQLENTVLIDQNQFIIEYVTTTQIEKSKDNHDGHIIWEVKLNILTCEYDCRIIRNTSFLSDIDLTSIHQNDDEIIIEAINNTNGQVYKSKLVKSKPRKFMIDIFNFEPQTLVESKKLVTSNPTINESDVANYATSTIFKTRNNNEYCALVESNKNIISHSYMGEFDIVTFLMNQSNVVNLATMVVNLKEKTISNLVINSIACNKEVHLHKLEKDIYHLMEGPRRICSLRFVRGKDFYKYNSKYRIKNYNGNNDIY